MSSKDIRISAFRTHLRTKLKKNMKSFVSLLILNMLGFPLIAAASLYASQYFRDDDTVYDIVSEQTVSALNKTFYFSCFSFIAAAAALVAVIIITFSSALSDFRYLHSRESSDTAFSLPLTKKQLFAADLILGLGTILIPAVIAAVIAAILFLITPGHFLYLPDTNFGNYENFTSFPSVKTLCHRIEISDFAELPADFIAVLLMLYAFMLLMTVCCGTGIESVYCFFVSGTALTAFTAFFRILLNNSVLNSADNYYPFREAECFSPFGGIIHVLEKSALIGFSVPWFDNWPEPDPRFNFWLPKHILYAVIYILAAGILFTKRPAEAASRPFAVPSLFFITSFLITGTVTFFFADSFPYSVFTFVFAVILLVSLGISAAVFLVMLFAKYRGIQIKKLGRQALFFICSYLIAAALTVSVKATNGFGMMYYVPAPEKVSSVLIYADGEGCCEYNDYDTIKAITELHSEINEETKTWTINGTSHIDEVVENGSLVNRKYKLTAYSAKIPGTYVINYLMKNGKMIARVVIPVNTDITDTPLFGVYNEIRSRSVHIPTDIIGQIAGSDAVFCGDTAYADELCKPRFSWFTGGSVHYPAEYRLTDFDSDILRELLGHAYPAWYISPDSCYVLYTETSPQFFIPKEYSELYNSLLKSASKEKLDWEWFPDN